MSLLDKLALAWCVVLVLLGAAALPPARSALAWYIRVGVPEIGWAFLLASLPALAWLLRTTPRGAAVLGGLLLVLYGWPWMLAWGIREELPVRVAQAFPGALLARDPLALGEVVPVESSTQEYRPGLSWDRHGPAGRAPRARVLFLHGGSWARGTRDEYPALVRYLAGRGYEVVSASYRLAPGAPFPAALEDVQAAIDRLASEGPEPLVVMGRSAGAHLGLLAAYRDPEKVSGVIDIYAPVDMRFSWANPSHPKVLDSYQVLGDFLGGSPQERGAVYDQASPVKALAAGGPPTLVIHGTRDSMVFPRQAGILEERLQALDVPHFVLRLPWLEHGGDVFLGGPTGRLTAWTVEAFLGWVVDQG